VLEARLATTEEQLADDPSQEFEARMAALTSRLEALEEAASAPQSVPPLAPGEGRLRIEVRALELRLQHAEAVGQESQQAVLLQLERLAAAIEPRLRRLEREHDDDGEEPFDPDPVGEVVSIHGTADT
jgi:hypothetical protein